MFLNLERLPLFFVLFCFLFGDFFWFFDSFVRSLLLSFFLSLGRQAGLSVGFLVWVIFSSTYMYSVLCTHSFPEFSVLRSDSWPNARHSGSQKINFFATLSLSTWNNSPSDPAHKNMKLGLLSRQSTYLGTVL